MRAGRTPDGGVVAGTCDTESGFEALHWAPGDACIAVTYEPEVEPYRGDLDRALEAWRRLDCSRLCFKEPVQSFPGEWGADVEETVGFDSVEFQAP